MVGIISAICLLPSAVKDYKEREVSRVSYVLLALAFIVLAITHQIDIKANILYAGLMFVVLFLYALKGGLGGGDVKIIAILTLVIGGFGALFSLVAGFFFMLIEELHKKIKRREKGSIPVVTYLCLGAFLYGLCDLLLIM